MEVFPSFFVRVAAAVGLRQCSAPRTPASSDPLKALGRLRLLNKALNREPEGSERFHSVG